MDRAAYSDRVKQAGWAAEKDRWQRRIGAGVTLSGRWREPAVVLSGPGDLPCPLGGHPR
jgi:hypothetical protein